MRLETGHTRVRLMLLLAYVVAVPASAVELSQFARDCGIQAWTYSPRIFADLGDGKWKEYKSSKEVPLGNPDWSETAYLEKKPGRFALATIQGSGQDFAEYASYCFDSAGKLTALEREFRTAWGWGFKDKRSYDSTGHESLKTHFFDIKTGHKIVRPADADGVKEALQTRVFRKLSDLPFSVLIESAKE